MRTIAILATASIASAGQVWWGGAPECADDCFSSFWSSASTWPAPFEYCSATQGPDVLNCLKSKCSATPTAITSYSSLSSALCANWASCSAAGSTGVYTVSLPGFTGAWGPGHSGPYPGGRWGAWGYPHPMPTSAPDASNPAYDWADGRWHDWTRTWSGGVYTVTGCEWDGNPWAGGPGGWGPGGAGGSPWGPWGKGWKWTTTTEIITRVVTKTDDGTTSLVTSVGPATVALAVSGDITSTSVLNAQETDSSGSSGGSGSSSSDSGAAAGRGEPAVGVMLMGTLLAGVVVVAGFL